MNIVVGVVDLQMNYIKLVSTFVRTGMFDYTLYTNPVKFVMNTVANMMLFYNYQLWEENLDIYDNIRP